MIQYIDQIDLKNQTLLVRVDFNVSLDESSHAIANDERVRGALPTIEFLLNGNNKLVLCSHLGQPKGYDDLLGLDNVAIRLQKLVPTANVVFYDYNPLLTPEQNMFSWSNAIKTLPQRSIALIDNLRYFPGEKSNDLTFAKALASMAQAYVGDAFGVAHRPDASVVGVPALLPHYGGLLMKKEIEMIGRLVQSPTHPFIAIIGGAKVETKLGLITKLADLADLVLVGGKLALESGLPEHHAIVKPVDYIYGEDKNAYDIGPKTIKKYTDIISSAKTIMWNGPMGKNEDPRYAVGTKAIYTSIISNREVISVIGGGDTITALSDASHLDCITHLSTGGGAMLEYIEKGTLPGIEALK